jgi:hypothetical protein
MQITIKGKEYWISAVGIRYDSREFKVGAKVPRSHDWVDGVRTDRALPGTCSLGIGWGIEYDDAGEVLVDAPNEWLTMEDVMQIAQREDYGFGHAYIIVGEDRGVGEDSVISGSQHNEQIIADARVLCKLW